MPRPALLRNLAPIRPTRAIVNLRNVAYNLSVVREQSRARKVFAVIKADAYGHGAVPVGRALAQAGADGLCVALPEEGIELREAGLSIPVLVLGGTYRYGAVDTVAFGLTPVVNDLEQVARLHEAARGGSVRVHLKVDTGMSRLGVPDHSLAQFFWRARRYPKVRFEGIMSHLAFAEHDAQATRDQIRRFRRALRVARSAGIEPRLVHLANSAGLLGFPEAHFDVVRPGLALYGVSPLPGLGGGLRAAMRVQTEVVQLRDLEVGDRVSYGGSFTATRPTKLAVLPVGYADGVSQRMAGAGAVLLRGQRAPIVGAVCMDMCMADVTEVAGAEVGDEVTLLGAQGDERITAAELSSITGTVPHEVLTSVSPRVPRSYER